MTCVVGLVDAEDNVWMAADSSSVDGSTVRKCWTPKIFGVGEVLIGYTVSFRMGQILRWNLELPGPPERGLGLRESVTPYVEGKLIEAIRVVLQRYHWSEEEHNRQSGCGLLLGFRGYLFVVGDDFAVVQMADMYDAIGAGQDFALGSLYSSGQRKESPMRRLSLALEAAAHFSGAVRDPAHYVRLAPDGVIYWIPSGFRQTN